MTAITACWCETLRKERDWRTRLSLLRDRRVEGCFHTETPQINYLIEERLDKCCVHSSYVQEAIPPRLTPEEEEGDDPEIKDIVKFDPYPHPRDFPYGSCALFSYRS